MESNVIASMLDTLMRVTVLEAIRAAIWGSLALAVTTYGVVLHVTLRKRWK